MGLFDKKYCDICGEKIGLLGNRKLENGNLCKNCARKLSPWFSDRRGSTVEEIRAQLAYRAENQEKVAAFHTTRTLGADTKVLLDEDAGKFMVTRARNLAEANPDVLDFADVTAIMKNAGMAHMGVGRAAGKGKAEARKRALELLEIVGLPDKADAYPAQLSGGMLQRAAAALLMALHPKYILADEPTGNLDSRTSLDVMGLIKVTSERFKQTIVMITHNEEIAQMADRIIRIEDGRIVADKEA